MALELECWKDLQPLGGDGVLWSYDYADFGEKVYDGADIFTANSSNSNKTFSCSCDEQVISGGGSCSMEAPAATTGRRKRRRTRIVKNGEEMENQRMTHIAVERNRRKQMNEYLAVLRSLMPSSYTQRGDQASIVGGTINLVKELEHLLHSLEAEKQFHQATAGTQFIFSTFISSAHNSGNSVAGNRSVAVNVEAKVMEGFANINIMAENQRKQLLKVVEELHSLHLVILHVNVTTFHQMVLYSFCVKIEDDCKLNTVNGITAAVHEIFNRIHP